VLLFTLVSSALNVAWAQTDYSGYYYISGNNQGQNSYVLNDRVNNYYLCPTVNWIYYDAEAANKFTSVDNGQPFLTSYHYRNGANDSTEAVWHIVKHATLNYYYIIHEKTGKYLASNAGLGAGSNANRLRVHLETVATPPPAEDRFLFAVTKPSYYNISPKENSGWYLNITQGNYNSLQGASSAKNDGPTGYKNVGGTLGLWNSATDYTSKLYFEEAFLEFPTITINAAGNVEISTHEADATIYYTTDGSDPQTSGTKQVYSGAITPTSSMTAIKARVIHNSNGRRSEIATQPLYTYHIVNLAGEVAIKQKVAQYVGVRLESYLNIPAAIRSPYLEGETLTFYSFSGAYNAANLVAGNVIEETPTSSANIYVTYTNAQLMSKFLHLRAYRSFNITINGDYIYDDSGTLNHNASPSDADKETNAYLWKIGKYGAEDPYAVLIMNKATENYFHYTTTPSLTFSLNDAAPSKFILMSGSAAGDGANYEQMELMAATGDDNYYRVGRTGDAFSISTTATGAASLQMRAYPVGGGVNYYLIDKAGKLIKIINSKSTALSLPEAWKSPLVDDDGYHYFSTPGYDSVTDTYTPSGTVSGEINPEVTPIIYVTYDVNDDVAFYDPSDDVVGTTYMLKFYGGENFYQENGLDGIMGTAQKAVYPYSNGDAMLYVYGQEQWNAQLASGASTRSRWLWYVESPTNDPYHVKIRSFSGQVSSNNYFRTYVVNYGGSNHVVTGVTTMNVAVSDPESANYQPPTEYMVLKTDNGRCKLVTVNEINDGTTTEHRTVTSFEQYWKNNPTVQNRLGGSKVTATETYSDNIELNADQLDHIPSYWHTYKAFANAAPWVGWETDNTGASKQYLNKNHWFQTIDMGSTGEFTFEATSLEPQVILLDQHGWEIMRTSLSDVATLRKYNSPMVETYHWYPTATKEDGYHKFTPGDPQITVYTSTVNAQGRTVWYDSGDRYTHTSSSLDDTPYSHMPEQDTSVKTDFYVTYDVKNEYGHLYSGAATEGAVQATAFLLKQGNYYAKIDGTDLTTVTTVLEDFESIGTDLQWYVKPNFNIDAEEGYKYLGEPGALDGALSKSAAEAAYYAAGKNGFDPYNVQIQSVANTSYYFTANTTGSHLSGGAWVGTSSDLTLDLRTSRQTPEGYQSTLHVTNATFMVVDDGSGHLRLMPRYDHSKVVNSFTSSKLTSLASADQYLTITMMPRVVHSSSELSVMGGNYILASDFTFENDFESLGSAGDPFTGSIDGRYHTFTGLSVPLLNYADGAIVRNLILDNVNITGDTNVGAIAANATGATRIYNCGILASGSTRDENGIVSSCSSTVSGSEKVGGIVGFLDGNARVIHCFSYANITGGTDVAGIVGYNNYASDANHIRTMVMNCMFYGDITSGSTIAPVYGGEIINNLNSGGLNNYNYYSYEELHSSTINKYNCALAVEHKYLKRFEFYRQLLNGNRRLAAYYASSSNGTVHPEDMMKWVLETADKNLGHDPNPYPILKEQGLYPSIINYDVRNLADYDEAHRNEGRKTGTLTVNIAGTGSGAPAGAAIKAGKSTLTLTRTDKDYSRYNFNYDKIQLPYYNEVGTNNYTSNKVVTGWKITSITAVGGDPYTASNYPASGIRDYPDHNYADRKSSQKDLYSVSGRVFSQGAYFDVPYGVTSITIEPYWGNAAYVADEYLDVVYNTSYTAQGVSQLGKQFPTGKITINGSEQTVHTTMTNALKALGSATVYDNAVVLVGTLHQGNVPADGTQPFTIMSVDLDEDNEPDYSMIYHHNNRQSVSPIRFDFLNIPGAAQAQKPNGTSTIQNFTIFLMRGWFETTNTCLVYSNQVEYENTEKISGGSKAESPLILLGGDFEQFVSTRASSVSGKTIYIHVGSNVFIKNFGLGTHSDGNKGTPHIPVSVTGGEYEGFYLTGTYNPNAAKVSDNAECYISGGHFVEAAGACLEAIGGNVHWQIYNADIDNFFGGGINDAKPIEGSITTDIFNSHVGLFCGGPKFGDMTTGKAVTTNATGCVFDQYFGAGYGGLSYSRQKYYDESGYNFDTHSFPFTSERGKYYDGVTTNANNSKPDYGKKGPGVATDFDYEFFVWSTGVTGARMYVKFASFSLAQCENVSSTLTGCTVNQNFYGGGSLGKVTGTATSVLNGCTVKGNVFGGGYSAELPTIPVRDAGFTRNPKFNSSSGMFEAGLFSGTTDYEWKNATAEGVTLTNGNIGFDKTKKYVYTNVDLTTLGQVANTNLTITGNCSIEGSVFGGGDESAVNENTLVYIQNAGATQNNIMNVYGGGNTADVLGNTEVNMTSGAVSHDVFGGGRGETTTVDGTVTVNIGSRTGEAPSFSYDGSGTIAGNVYGGSALGTVAVATVNIYGGEVSGSVFGGGLGQVAVGSPGDPGYVAPLAAQNLGNATVNVEHGTVATAIYGGSNANGVLKQDAMVTITGGTVGTAPVPATNIVDRVFGGGKGEPTLVEGNVTVKIGTEGQATGGAVLYGNVYGGSALGNTAASRPVSDLVFDGTKETNVKLFKGVIHGNVFGGGLGQKNGEYGATSDILSYVGGNVTVLLDGAQLVNNYDGTGVDYKPVTGQIFGANNLNGSPKGHVKVWVKRTVISSKDTSVPRDSRTTYDVAAVYGGGNKADYRPTDAELTLDDTDPAYDPLNPEKVAAATAQVIIEGCDQTSIEYVYGGGNAAAVPATDVTILGTYIIDYVFGGGNGRGTGNPGANVGTYNNGASNYGTGKAVTKLVGGHIHDVFGGSNTLGNIRGGTTISMPEEDAYVAEGYDCCTVRDIKEIYGAGNEAEQDGDVTLILGCVDNMDYVYGGARNAHVKGGVDLVVTSGHFKGIFGGNDTSGTIQGPITVTIEETGCKPLVIDNLYLGGNNAAYSVYGYKDVAGTLTARSSMTDGVAVNPPADDPGSELITEEQLYPDPILNVISCTSIGNVFGGGYGATAVMYGNPTVNINMIKGNQVGVNDVVLPKEYKTMPNITYVSDEDEDYIRCNINNEIGSIGNVYGGGSAASVMGDTHVNICTEATVAVRSEMGAPIVGTPTDVEGATITGNVFGAGLGLETVVESTFVVMAGGSVAKSVYGGGELGCVNGNTHITVTGGSIGDPENERGGAVIGNVYGGGKGLCETDHLTDGLVKGNTNINISGGSIYHNIYGGGAYGSVGTYTIEAGVTTCASGTGVTRVTITGGTIGINGKENGMVFGSSRGDVAIPTGAPLMDINDRLAWVHDTYVTIGTPSDETPGPVVKGSVYGSGENGHTYNNTHVEVHSGTIGIHDGTSYDATRGNVYGGGCGTDQYDSNGDDVDDTYNPLAGIVKGSATVQIDGGTVLHNVYGGGAMGSVDIATDVTISGTAVIGYDGDENGNVYASSRGDETLADSHQAYAGASTLTISGGTVKGSGFGGGQNGLVKGAVSVSMTNGTVQHDLYGGGALAKTNTEYDSTEHPTYTTTVALSGGTVTGNLYGGGLGRQAEAGPPAVTAIAADVNGPVTVAVSGGKAANVFGCNNEYGAPQHEVTVNVTGTADVDSGTAIGNVYGGGNQAAYPDTPIVTISGGTINNVYGGGLGSTAITGGSSVTISGTAAIANDVYGGGSEADVTGNVNVTVSGGIITNDVYGGGALANTNTGNWNGDGSIEYEEVTGLVGETYRVKEVLEGASVTGLYTYNGVSYVDATGTAVGGTTYYEKLSGAPVAGYYTESAGIYTKLTSGTAVGGTTYYKKKVKGTWVTPAPINGTDYYTTTVSLTGGLIGNAYGGGLGNSTTAANVYGDVTITVNEGVSDPTKGVTFIQRVEQVTIAGTQHSTPTSGRVFGCNNHNGTPTGDVEVHVYSTRQIDKDNNIIAGHGSGDRKYQYEIQSVYGGGNQADYLPASGKKSTVIIEGCEDTSIEKVYGGGNSAVVPETDVKIYGAYDIGYAFGGGNGDKPIKKADGIWYENEGAIVIGLASIICHGGKIGQVFGGGDSKGSCGNTNAVTSELLPSDPNYCPLHITRLYGAGNKGDVASVNIVLAACSGNAIEYVHGGSYNAHVTGNVHLTITSGILKNVYGGNDARGGIGGDIIVDIEETNGCNPIIIQNLVGGGNEAPYPGTHIVGDEEVAYTTRGKITVNVKSATRIDNIYGGSFMAETNADTKVNVNMIKGNKAGTTVTIPKEFNYIPNISNIVNVDSKTISCLIDDAIGTIGNVYGGGNQGIVKGNTVVNICSSDKVSIMQRDGSGKIKVEGGGVIDAENGSNLEGETILYDDDVTVLGADIRGNVFGGGNMAEVSTYIKDAVTYGGNATVNICARESAPGEYEAVAFGVDDVRIGNSVYGGGNESDVDGNTFVRMYNGYVFDGVYGGGLKGSVGTFTRSTAVTDFNHVADHAGCIGKPVTCTAGGTCTVVVSGGQVGPKETAKTNGGMKNTGHLLGIDGPVDVGFVFGAGRGDVEDPTSAPDTHFKTYVNETYVTISGGLIMASVYGGGENGRVLHDTHVSITGGQIGCGETSGEPAAYAESQFINPATAGASDIESGALAECASWDYGYNIGTKDIYLPYDPYGVTTPDAESESCKTGSDGHTYYGYVFGGGSGYFPHETKAGGYDWLRSAGWVEGNTLVEISGGHILTNVYGGNEMTDVGKVGDSSTGKCTIRMTGGTLGVPRTLDQIAHRPVTCYLFGGGKGDPRTRFNTWTNVNSVEVDISGGIIYGSVFGGGEDGHVMGNVSMTIRKGANYSVGGNTIETGPIIGTWGTSYVDGNLFGGGRGYTGTALTAGNIGGNVDVTISGGTLLGSVYGGGRLGSVGYDLVAPEDPKYGVIQDGDRGHVTVDISDGTGKTVIGNKYEFMYLTSSVNTTGMTEEQIAAARKAELKNTYHVTAPDVTYQLANKTGDYDHYMINHTRGGCVYGGGMGRRELLDGTKNTLVDWTKLGNVKSTKVNIHGTNVWIKGSVFGGGEFAAVTGSHTSEDSKTVGTETIINGGVTIGSVIGHNNDTYNRSLDTDNRTQTGSNDDSRYTYGGAYGGGFGTEEDATLSTPISEIKNFGALVSSNTSIKLLSGAVRSSLYGGGKVACVAGDTYVTVSGGTVGVGQTRQNEHPSMGADYVLFGGMRMGNVYGGGRGSVNSVVAGVVKGNANINITGGSIYHNVYGGGAVGSLGDFDLTTDENKASYGAKYANVPVNWKENTGLARVTITGGTIGTNGHDSGMVSGSSRGDISTNQPTSTAVSDPYDHVAWVNKAIVTIGTAGQGFVAPQPQIKGSVYGGGENGHNYGDAEVYVHSGTIGIVDTPGDTWSNRGSVYGAGCGTDTYSKHYDESSGTYINYTDGYNHYNPMGGRVQGNTTVSVDGGHIIRGVYGAGSMGSVSGNATVTVSGGRIGTDGNGNGNVYGGPKGTLMIDPTDPHAEAHAENSTVTISYATTPASDDGSTTHAITGSVFGGGEAGLIRGNVTVNMDGGLVKHSVYGGGDMASVGGNTFVDLQGGVITEDAFGGGRGTATIAPEVRGNVIVELNNNNAGAEADGTQPGCRVHRIFGCNDRNGTPRGNVKVRVYATQHKNKSTIDDKYEKFTNEVSTDEEVTSLASTLGVNLAGYSTLEEKRVALAKAKYDVDAVYGGGNLAAYQPYGPLKDGTDEDFKNTEAFAEVDIFGCDLTSIRQVYGGGNAASAPATSVFIFGAYEIDQSFGGGNGLDIYQLEDGKWYENPGANVGYHDFMHYVKVGETGYSAGTHGSGTELDPYKALPNDDATNKDLRALHYAYGAGEANSDIIGGRIHVAYGGSNAKGNIREMVLSKYENNPECTLVIDKTYGGGNEAETDAEINVEMACIEYRQQIFGGSTKGDVNSDIHLRVTNGVFDEIYGGNDRTGLVKGSITVDIIENGCRPIVIDHLFLGGYKAGYSIYGYNADSSPRTKEQFEAAVTTALTGHESDTEEQKQEILITAGLYGYPKNNPKLNIISATRINNLYGGGNDALVIGNPYVNVNMERGRVMNQWVDESFTAADGNFTTGSHTVTEHGLTYTYNVEGFEAVAGSAHGNALLSIGTIGNIFGGGNEHNIIGDTHVDIGTGSHYNDSGVRETITPARNAAFITGRVYGGGNLGNVSGNTTIEMDNGYVGDRIYGGGKEGHVGTVSTWASLPAGHPSHSGCLGKGAPTAFASNTGKCTIIMSGGHLGPFDYGFETGVGLATPTPMTMPTDYGYVFGAGRGELANPTTDPDIDFRTYVNTTDVIIKNRYEEGYEGGVADSLNHIVSSPLIAGGVYGGSENGRVLGDTHVNIWGGQIGIGADMTTAFAEADFIDPTTATAEQIDTKAAAMRECAAWTFGVDTNDDGKKDTWLPYDEYAGDAEYDAENYGAASTTGSDGHTFYGNVFGGGSGYFTYENADGSREWLHSAGLVEGDTYVNISGGHILTNIYGGNELTDVTGTCHITMTGGTLGVPRTVDQILAHPLTGYLFGAGKGDTRVHFNKFTNVAHVDVKISGGIIYGSVFGGGEDGHVMGNVTMNIGTGAKIGTWGTSYVDGNVFGGGRGFSGEAYTAGNVAGSVTMNISGGTMLGSIYGGGRLGSVGYGLFPASGVGSENYGKMQPDNKDDEGSSVADFPRGHVNIAITGGTIGNKYEMIYPVAANIPVGLDADFKNWSAANWTTWKEANHVPNTSYDTSNGRLTHTRGGNVYAGGMGRREQLDGVTEISAINWLKLGAVKSTSLTISGDPWIMSSVYGGGELGSVVPYTNGSTEGGTTTVTITGGTIGSEITSTTVQKDSIPTTATRSDVKYTFGSVYGGGMGELEHGLTDDHGGDVGGNTTINISGANTKVRASVYGGGEMAYVGGNATVTISNGRIGRNEVKPADDPDAGYVLFGGSTMGNVYGAGKGARGHGHAGQVKGNTTVNISGGSIYHNVYGGGALASVGDFKLSDGAGTPAYISFADVPYDWKENTGLATVNITGGTIGITGRDNGMVNGSSRGDLERPTGSPAVDHYDKLAWVNNSIVNIGTDGSGTDFSTPLIKGSVYGGGENGHNSENATVNVFSGTIGISDDSDPWYNFTNPTVAKKAQITRGNVYGAGCGTDTYTGADGKEYYNPKSGMVGKVTRVNIKGGHVVHNVYGGGSMGSVGTVTDSVKHENKATSFALSWPYEINYAPGTGKSYVTVTGGRIGMGETGVVGEDNGNVYGGTRGMAGSHYYEAHLANVNETYVTINYAGETPTSDNGSTTPLITGSVFGGCEDGHVLGDTHVSMQNGLIKHSLFAGGRGQGTFEGRLKKLSSPVATPEYTALRQIRSITAGKVYGNTYLEMSGGRVWHNVFGGGYMASVGKGNYAGGSDDYATGGYGETITTNLWDNDGNDSRAFLSSGMTHLTITGGTIGLVGPDLWDGLPSGSVFGGSRGVAAPNITDFDKVAPEYCPDFFSGYVNETYVTIGGEYRCVQACVDNNSVTHAVGEALNARELKKLFAGNATVMDGDTPKAAYWEAVAGDGPTIYGSVYGGGQDGHVRREAHMIVNKGEIGLPYTAANRSTLGTSGLSLENELNSPLWMLRGNVFGAGSGLGQYSFDMDGNPETADETGYSTSAGSVTHFTQVDVNGGKIHRNVYGGGSLASVGPPPVSMPYDIHRKDDTSVGIGHRSVCLVNIAGTIGTPVDYNEIYGGEVYGASRGSADLDPTMYSTTLWTVVNVKDGANIMNNVFGGGDAGAVSKNTEVNVGEAAAP